MKKKDILSERLIPGIIIKENIIMKTCPEGEKILIYKGGFSFSIHLETKITILEKGSASNEYYMIYSIMRNEKTIIKIQSDIVNKLLTYLNKTVIPISPEYVMGLDGVTKTLILNRGFNSVVYKWWGGCSCNKGWAPLERVGKFLEHFAETVCKQSVVDDK